MISLTISDDGKGFPLERKGGGMGLRTMRYRAQVMGATLTFSPTSKDGAWVRCEVPVLRA